MSSRYPPLHDSRYTPRDRSRSPPRFQDRRPSGPFNSPFAGRNPPLGPRGRGSSFYPDGPSPDPRGPPPPSAVRDRAFRERDFDRRGRPPSPPPPPLRPRSPQARIYRDAPSPRELELNRARRDSRDLPFSAGPNFNDAAPTPPPPPFPNQSFPRGGFGAGRGRGIGRGDIDFRDRGRRPPFDDRNTFRPRERSPPPRWNRDDSRESRDERRIERQDEDRWSDRDVRERDPAWLRRDSTAHRFDARPEVLSRPQTPHQSAPVTQPSVSERSSIDVSRDGIDSRKSSASVLPAPAPKDIRQEVNSQNPRASPPPQAPSVPAFGSVSFKPNPSRATTSNVWRPPQETRQPPPPPSPVVQPQRTSSPVPRPAPMAARAQIPTQPPAPPSGPASIPTGPKPPPEAPKAPRALEAPPVPGFRGSMSSARPAVSATSPQIPTGPAALRNGEKSLQGQIGQQPRDRIPPSAPAPKSQASFWSSSVSPRLSRGFSAEAGHAHTTPGIDQQSPVSAGPADLRFPRNDSQSAKLETPPPTAPSGPRAHALSTSPQALRSVIPTAPKADRAPPTGPRGSNVARAPPNAPRGPSWNQWRPPNGRDAVIPAKRDANGEERGQLHRSLSSSSQSADLPRAQAKDETNLMHGQLPDAREVSAVQSSFDEREHARLDARQPKPASTNTGALDDVGDPVEASESDESSDDDGMDLDEEDFEATKLKFEQQKARLQAQLIDLSDRQYRATTPLEHLARLAKITVNDLPSADELSSMADAPELEEEDASRNASQEPEEVDQDLLTPKEEEQEAEDVLMENGDAQDRVLPPSRRKLSPEVINLPYLLTEPMSPRESIQEHSSRQRERKAALVVHLKTENDQHLLEESELADEYADAYQRYKEIARQYDEERAERERAERQKSVDTGPDLDVVPATLETPTTENSRRLHKFSSEYDIQKVLKESEETARIEQERLDREAQKAKDSMEKEAVLPDLLPDELKDRRMFKNTNNLRDAWHLTDIYGYQPPSDDFTSEEHRIFLENFKERPKKWGEIAAALPGRTYQHCIHHYYAFKWDGRFRETKGKRKPRLGRGRGAKVATRLRGAGLMADLGRTEEEVASGLVAGAGSSTEAGSSTGRPRRAAASRAVNQPVESEAKGTTASPVKKNAKAENGETGSDKPVKKRRGAGGERVAKKGRAQPIAAAPAGSPVKADVEGANAKGEGSNEELSLPIALQLPSRPPPVTVPIYHTEGFFQPPVAAVAAPTLPPPPPPSQVPHTEPAERASASSATQSNQQRPAASSYWSVPEQSDFVKFLGYFGTDFAAIAAHMGTKTQTMVKNHFQRHSDSGNRPDLIEIAEEANTRRARGEDMGMPPTPTPIVRRRFDNPGPVVSRGPAQQPDVSEVEDAALPADGMSVLSSAAAAAALTSLQSQARSSAATLPTSTQQRVAPTSLQSVLASTAPKATPPAASRSSQSVGPKMGFFTESRPESRPSAQATQAPRQVPQTSFQQFQSEQQVRLQQDAHDVNSSWFKSLIRERDRAMNMQKEQEQRLSQERVPTLSQHHASVYPDLAPQPSRAVEMARRSSVEDRAPTPAAPLSSSSTARPGLNMLRNLLGSPAANSSAIPSLPPPPHSPHDPSPPRALGFRPSSVPVPSPAPPPVKPATSTEPRKTSNLAALLNSEPEEPRPQRRFGESSAQSVNRPQSPASLQRNPTPTGPSMFSQPRRETIGQASAPRSIFDRPLQNTPAPTPPSKHEHPLWSSLASARSREDWTPRGPLAQALPPPSSSSPNPVMQLDRDRTYLPQRTSGLGPLGEPSRNASPPPHGHPFISHSRTSSFSHGTPPQQHPPPVSQAMQQLPPRNEQPSTKPSSVLQPNPYAQPPGPAPHIQQMQAQQQNQLHHAHNMGLHARHGSGDEEIARERERAFRERVEYDRAREREAAFQAEQQHRYGQQHRPSSQAMHAPIQQGGPPLYQHPGGPVDSLPRLSFREQAEREGMAGYREAQWRLDRERAEAEAGRMEQEMEMRRRQADVESRRRFEELRAPGPGPGQGQGQFSRTPGGEMGFAPPRRR